MRSLEVSVDKLFFYSHLHLLVIDDSLIFQGFGKIIYVNVARISAKHQSDHVGVYVKGFNLFMWNTDVQLNYHLVFLFCMGV